MQRWHRAGTGFLLAMSLAYAAHAIAAYQAGGTVLIRQPVAEDLYIGGRSVEILAPVQGDLVVGSQRLRLAAPVTGDLIAAGERLQIVAAVEDDARLAGREIEVRAPIGGHLLAAGATVELGGEATVSDWAWLAGATLRLDGRVGSLKAAGNTVLIAGTVEGDAEVTAERVELLAGARIGGDLIVRSRSEPIIDAGASVAGRVIHTQPPEDAEEGYEAGVVAGLMALLVMLVTTGVIYLLFPRYAHAAGAEARAQPLKALALGLALLAATPLLIVLLFLTGVGVLLGLALLALYLVGLLLGLVSGVFCVADGALRRRDPARRVSRGKGLLAVVAVVLLLGLLQLVPVLGGLLIFLLLLLGLGALALRLWHQYRAPVADIPHTKEG